MTAVDDIMADMVRVLRPAIEAALADARADAKQEAATEFKAKLAAMFDDGQNPVQDIPRPISLPRAASVASRPADREGRATSGTVKPAIVKMLRDAPAGLTTREITEATGFKYNSVRGTLWLLKKEGHAANQNDKWFPASKEYRERADAAEMTQ